MSKGVIVVEPFQVERHAEADFLASHLRLQTIYKNCYVQSYKSHEKRVQAALGYDVVKHDH